MWSQINKHGIKRKGSILYSNRNLRFSLITSDQEVWRSGDQPQVDTLICGAEASGNISRDDTSRDRLYKTGSVCTTEHGAVWSAVNRD